MDFEFKGLKLFSIQTERQTDKQTDRQTYRARERQTDRQSERERQIDGQRENKLLTFLDVCNTLRFFFCSNG